MIAYSPDGVTPLLVHFGVTGGRRPLSLDCGDGTEPVALPDDGAADHTYAAEGTYQAEATDADGRVGAADVVLGPPEPTGVTLTPNHLDLVVMMGDGVFTCDVQPPEADQTMTWQTSDINVCTADDTSAAAMPPGDCICTPMGPGTATITGTTVNGLTATATVTVTAARGGRRKAKA